MGGRGLRERGKDVEGEEGKPTQASNSKTAYGPYIIRDIHLPSPIPNIS